MSHKNPKIQKFGITLEKDLRPRTQNQSDYIRSILENTITFGLGFPGSGKSFIAIGMGCKYLAEGKVDTLVLSKPIVNCGDGIGWLAGSLADKTMIYFYPLIDCVEFFLGKEQTKTLIQNNIIKLMPLEYMRGTSIRNSFLVLDEGSNASTAQLKMLLSRIDQGSTFVINGDYKQTDLKYCDFRDIADKLQRPIIDGLGFVEFGPQDCQRNKIINKIMERLE